VKIPERGAMKQLPASKGHLMEHVADRLAAIQQQQLDAQNQHQLRQFLAVDGPHRLRLPLAALLPRVGGVAAGPLCDLARVRKETQKAVGRWDPPALRRPFRRRRF
jgi:hypothetical protein